MKEAVNPKTSSGKTAVRIRTILVPIDFSPQSLEALDYASALGERFGGELHVSYVLEPDFAYAVPYLLELPPFTTPEEVGATRSLGVGEGNGQLRHRRQTRDRARSLRARLRSDLQTCERNPSGPDRAFHARLYGVEARPAGQRSGTCR